MWGLIGQEGVISTLERGLAQGRLAHAYLLVGPTGVGKRSLALALAQTVNCLSPEDAGHAPCGGCSQCRRISASLHPDVTLLALQGEERELSIERVRDLQRSLSLKPFEGRCRVAIIRDAERLSHEAANALLKLLEEPPPDCLILLTTSEEEHVLPTIRSRCQRLPLSPISSAAMSRALQKDHGLDPEEAARLAALAQGCPGRAFAALAQPGVLEALSQSLAQLKDLLEKDTAARLGEVPRLTPPSVSAREAAMQTLRRWQVWWRDLLLVKTGCQDGMTYLGERRAYERYSDSFSLAAVRGALEALQRALLHLEQNANTRLVLDVLVLSLPSLESAGPVREPLQ